jgi:subtilisin family serine protease
MALSNAMAAIRDAGIIVVAACGNGATNIDVTPVYPIQYGFDNIVAVASVGRSNALSSFSNFGASRVELAAPGEQIYSTFGATDNFYLSQSGTSFAAPYVAGAMALMLAKYPGETHQQIIARVLHAVDPVPALAGKCRTGGRLNLREALSPAINISLLSPVASGAPVEMRVSAGPRRLCVVEACATLPAWVPIHTNTTSAAGTFEFTDCDGLPRRFYRVTAAP